MEYDEDEDDGEPDESDDPSDSADTEPCPTCGRPVYEDADRCPHCGNYISPGPATRKPIWLIVGAIVCLLLIWFFWVK